ncbi:MAG: L-threonylcarbamoyladenylate synthase [Spirochaetia bacterium]|jgi:L-threonylcarbamoyladenylate synthase|nr:L-threonylcarbamoyladenylate synthase [Spirochaetia bacterium]
MVFKKTDKKTIEKITENLKNNGIVILPCDTIYGITCIPGIAEDRIREIKGREENKQFIKLIPSVNYLENISADIPDTGIFSLWPAPLTLIINAKTGRTEAVRVPQDNFLIEILSLLGKPLVSTSVNRSGNPAMNNITDIVETFEKTVDLIIDGGDMCDSAPSTIVDLTSRPFKILRQGKCVVPAEYLV